MRFVEDLSELGGRHNVLDAGPDRSIERNDPRIVVISLVILRANRLGKVSPL